MLGSESGHVEVVDKLLQYGAKVNLQSQVCMSFASECMQGHIIHFLYLCLHISFVYVQKCVEAHVAKHLWCSLQKLYSYHGHTEV